MNKNSKLFFAFAAGALVGAGIAALFTTEKGKAIVDKAKGKMDNLSDEVQEKIKKFENDIADLFKQENSTQTPEA